MYRESFLATSSSITSIGSRTVLVVTGNSRPANTFEVSRSCQCAITPAVGSGAGLRMGDTCTQQIGSQTERNLACR